MRILWWLTVGWWYVPVKWLYLWPVLIIRRGGRRKSDKAHAHAEVVVRL